MPHFDSDGIDIAYVDEGNGDPILLIHGFASSAQVNWVDTGWVRHLTREGRRVIAMDNRGHGHSAKPHDPALYGGDRFFIGIEARLCKHRVGRIP